MQSKNLRDHRNSPTYWFARLEIARERSDFEGAAEAQRELDRLGIHICYDSPRRAGEGAKR